MPRPFKLSCLVPMVDEEEVDLIIDDLAMKDTVSAFRSDSLSPTSSTSVRNLDFDPYFPSIVLFSHTTKPGFDTSQCFLRHNAFCDKLSGLTTVK
jgi:hypothetical protein